MFQGGTLNYIDHLAAIIERLPGSKPYPFVTNLFEIGLKPQGKYCLVLYL